METDTINLVFSIAFVWFSLAADVHVYILWKWLFRNAHMHLTTILYIAMMLAATVEYSILLGTPSLLLLKLPQATSVAFIAGTIVYFEISSFVSQPPRRLYIWVYFGMSLMVWRMMLYRNMAGLPVM
jgi:hypothetical protein